MAQHGAVAVSWSDARVPGSSWLSPLPASHKAYQGALLLFETESYYATLADLEPLGRPLWLRTQKAFDFQELGLKLYITTPITSF